jgi:uncharacterized protein DUF4388
MLITGNFREYPFFLLLEIFLRRRETGLLEVSSTEESGYFYIKNGKVKDGQVGKKKGLAAVKLVGKFNDGSFQFKPLAPSDYARVVWQRSFGPTRIANDQLPICVPATRNRIGQFGSRAAAAYRVSNALDSLTQRAVRQILVYTSVALHGIQTIVLSLPRRCVASGFAFWKNAQVGTRLPLLIASIKNTLGHVQRRIAAVYVLSERALASTGRRTLRQFVLYTPIVYHTLKKNGRLVSQRTVAYATLGSASWKRAQVGTRLLRILKRGLAVPQHKRRRDRHLTSGYPHHVRFRPPSLTTPNKAAIAGALQQGIEHNMIFALIVTVLLGMSGLMLHQLVFDDQHLRDAGTVDEHFDTPVNASRTRAKPKRHGSKRPPGGESKDKSGDKGSTDQKPDVSSTQQPDAISPAPRRNQASKGETVPN